MNCMLPRLLPPVTALGLLLSPCGMAQTIQTIGDKSAVMHTDLAATFDALSTNGHPLSDYAEGGLIISTDADNLVDVPGFVFDPFHPAPDRSFYCPDGGSTGWTVITTGNGNHMHAVEFLYGNGWTTGDIYGTPWGNSNARLVWETWTGSTLVSSGTVGDMAAGQPMLPVGTVVGFFDIGGFDQLRVKCTIATSADPNLQVLAMDNLKVQVTAPCGTADFNGDGNVGTDQDIAAFFACLSGNCCDTCYVGGADFNADGNVGTDQDIESFFRVLAGGAC